MPQPHKSGLKTHSEESIIILQLFAKE